MKMMYLNSQEWVIIFLLGRGQYIEANAKRMEDLE